MIEFLCWNLFGVTQGSILGPPLLNAYKCDLFYDIDELDFATFADDNTPYYCLSDMASVLGKLKWGIDTIFFLFTKKFLKGNASKYLLRHCFLFWGYWCRKYFLLKDQENVFSNNERLIFSAISPKVVSCPDNYVIAIITKVD